MSEVIFDNLFDVKVEGGVVKSCSVCQVFRPLDAFYKHRATCKRCLQARTAKWQRDNRARRNAHRRKSYAATSWKAERSRVLEQVASLTSRVAFLVLEVNRLKKR